MEKQEIKITIDDNLNVSVDLKNINIRNVDAKLYKQFSQEMKSKDISIGEAFNSLMRDSLQPLSTGINPITMNLPINISGFDHFEVNNKDLIEGEAPCIFENIKTLEFGPDLTKETFKLYVKFIVSCDLVRVPNNIPKLQLYSKLKKCGKIITY